MGITLSIRTDNPMAEIGLFKDLDKLGYLKWQADRNLSREIHQKIDELLKSQKLSLKDVSGIIFYEGPGSFTGLRIGASVANALAYSLDAPVSATTGESWLSSGLTKIKTTKQGKYPVPKYGAPVKITRPKK